MRPLYNDELCVHVIFVFELSAALFAICCGGFIVSQVTSGCVGFRFLGITLILIGVAFVIILYIITTRDRTLHDYENRGLKFFCFSMPLLLVLLALGIFALAVSSKGGGESIPGRIYKVYHVEAYSKWMQNKVNHNWNKYYKNVVVENKDIVCTKFSDQFGLDPALQFGCCQPPEECNFNYTNPKIYLGKRDDGNYNDDDCNRWDDDPNTLCFNCQSCKAGFLQDVTRHWFLIGLVLVVVVGVKLLLGIPYICLIFSNIREDNAERKRLERMAHGYRGI